MSWKASIYFEDSWNLCDTAALSNWATHGAVNTQFNQTHCWRIMVGVLLFVNRLSGFTLVIEKLSYWTVIIYKTFFFFKFDGNLEEKNAIFSVFMLKLCVCVCVCVCVLWYDQNNMFGCIFHEDILSIILKSIGFAF